MLARTLKESFRGNLDCDCHENRRIHLISELQCLLQFSLTFEKFILLVPAFFFKRFVDFSYDRHFKTLQSRRLLQGLIKQREIELSCDSSTSQYQSSSGLLRYHELTEI